MQVQAFVSTLLERGDIYLGTFEGWYDEGQEEYHTETSARGLGVHISYKWKTVGESYREKLLF